MAYRFAGVEISNVTIENYQMELPASLAAQVEMFLPPGIFRHGLLATLFVQPKNL